MSFVPFLNRHPRGDLSAYADGELSPGRAKRLEAHVESCAPCRADLDALLETKAALGALPEAAAPRSFALTPEMAERPVAMPQRLRDREAPAFGLRIASAGLAMALAIVVVADINGGSGSTSTENRTAADIPSTELQMSSGADSATGEDSSGSVGGVAGGEGPNLGASPKVDTDPNLDDGATVPENSVPPGVAAPGTSGEFGTPAPAELAQDDLGDDSATSNQLRVTTDDSGGGDTLRIAEIILGAGLVLALAASVAVTRLGRRTS